MTATKPAAAKPAITDEKLSNLYALTCDAYNLEVAITEAAEGLVSDDPEVVAAATAELEALIAAGEGAKDALMAKADAWCWVIDRLTDQAAARRAHAARLTELAKADDRKADAMTEKLIDRLLFLEPAATRFDLPTHQLKSTKVTKVEVDDDMEPEDMPVEYQNSNTTITVDKTALKNALKAGTVVKGATLLEYRSWRLG